VPEFFPKKTYDRANICAPRSEKTSAGQGARLSKSKKILLETVQFVPVITFAVSFVAAGEVDLKRASVLFVVSAVAAVLITVFLVIRKLSLNPILLGTDIWLGIGALAFGIPVPQLAALVDHLRAAGLFACVLGLGLTLTWASPTGYIGMSHPNRRLVRDTSFLLLILTAGALAWSWINTDNIRLGGGLPFVLLNVIRRVIIRRASK
jgi:hypothetical protein